MVKFLLENCNVPADQKDRYVLRQSTLPSSPGPRLCGIKSSVMSVLDTNAQPLRVSKELQSVV